MTMILLFVLFQEIISLTTPIVVPDKTTYQPVSLEINILPQPQIQITIRGNDGIDERFVYPCKPGECTTDTVAETEILIDNLNTKVNMTTRSLWRRMFDRLCADFPTRFPGGCTVK